jgi:hypothetical protein
MAKQGGLMRVGLRRVVTVSKSAVSSNIGGEGRIRTYGPGHTPDSNFWESRFDSATLAPLHHREVKVL